MAVRDYESSYKAFVSMPESEWLALLGSLFGGGMLEPEEQRAFEVAMADRKKLRTEACGQGWHHLCDGSGTLDDGATLVRCRCHCRSYEDDDETGLAGHPDGNGER